MPVFNLFKQPLIRNRKCTSVSVLFLFLPISLNESEPRKVARPCKVGAQQLGTAVPFLVAVTLVLKGAYIHGHPCPRCIATYLGRNGIGFAVQSHDGFMRFFREWAKTDTRFVDPTIAIQVKRHGLSMLHRIGCLHIHRRRRIHERIVPDRHPPPLREARQELDRIPPLRGYSHDQMVALHSLS